MVIDFRLRPPYGDFLKSAQFNPERNAKMTKSFGMWQTKSTLEHSMELFIQEMDAAGIDQGVMTGRVSSSMGNVTCESIREIFQKWPGRFHAFAGGPLLDHTRCQEIIDREIVNGPFAGLNVEPMSTYDQPMYADDRRIYPVYEMAQSAGIPVMIMTGGFCDVDMSYTHPQHIANVAQDFPDLLIVCPHGCWPHTREMVQVALRKDNVYIEADIYSMGLPGWQDYIWAANNFCQDRFLYGSAHPTMPMDGCIEFYRKAGIREEVWDKIM
ncbi:MAG: amidohydrolase family protein, partial [Mailhella sp.]|nr:amidohydrolase family protein [Mailhella sp.]